MGETSIERWQARMAPVMVGMILFAAIFFSGVSFYEFGKLEGWVTRAPEPGPSDLWSGDPKPSSFAERLQVTQTRAAYELERDVIAQRYNAVNLVFSARLWTRFMGFITGMILALVGAAFVLGKLSESLTKLTGSAELAGKPIALALSSSSPGLVLAVLGTILMGTALLAPVSANTQDTPTYFGVALGDAAAEPAAPPPSDSLTGPAADAPISARKEPAG